jgi:uncharacterized small protein (DUF1192 family)
VITDSVLELLLGRATRAEQADFDAIEVSTAGVGELVAEIRALRAERDRLRARALLWKRAAKENRQAATEALGCKVAADEFAGEEHRAAEELRAAVKTAADHLGRLSDLRERRVSTIREAYAHAQEIVLAALLSPSPPPSPHVHDATCPGEDHSAIREGGR